MPDLLEDSENGVAVLTLNRPERLNALSAEMLDALHAALLRFSVSKDVGAVILTGAGRGFCAGGDVKNMSERGDRPLEERAEELRIRHRVITLMRRMPRVIIGAINGPAFGAGLGLALACDLRIAAASARFGTAFAGVGFSGDFGGSYHLTKILGPTRAKELYFLAEPFDAEQAKSWGVVNRVVPDAELMTEALSLGRRIAEGPRIAYGYMKRNLLAAEYSSLEDVLELEAFHQARTALTDDHREARLAFVEKRKPRFTGR
ncbi:MAG: enoyl-CoA hydratase [Acidobacteriia bacterium]|nr:enoyl-CoA hydratase [Methyloceanibacter sp.]MBX5471130.1 enoyl-CoA hydratase [Acetobacteraceae bacterium]MCL6490916.1 enoyl-CoA hydratase [Terriglobia bacterium]